MTGDVCDIGDDGGELSPDDGELSPDDGELSPDDGDGLLDEVEVGEEPETGVMSQRSNPEPVSELTKLVRPAPSAELISQVLEVR